MTSLAGTTGGSRAPAATMSEPHPGVGDCTAPWAADPVVRLNLDRPVIGRVVPLWDTGMPAGAESMRLDREAAAAAGRAVPDLAGLIGDHAGFVRKALRWLRRRWVSQYLILGCGSPGAVVPHHVLAPTAEAGWAMAPVTVGYVDVEPVSVARWEITLDEVVVRHGRAAAFNADLLDPGRVWALARDAGVLDPDRPVGIVLTGVAHHIADTAALAAAIAGYDRLAPAGSRLVFSHLSTDQTSLTHAEQVRDLARVLDSVGCDLPLILRNIHDIHTLLRPLRLTCPGMVPAKVWSPGFQPRVTADRRYLAGCAELGGHR